MLDLIGAIGATGAYALLIGVIAGYLPGDIKLRWLLATALWGVAVVIIAGLGGFRAGAAGPVPAPAFALVAALGLLFGAFALSVRFRDALLAMPFAVLIALNVARIGGLFFLLLAADGRMSGPFPSSAGWGDIAAGVAAIPLAILAARRPDRAAAPIALWNAFGILDLLGAISLGMLSAPGTPFRVFMEGVGTAAMTGLPWSMLPSALVPLYLFIHFAIFAKLYAARRGSVAGLVHV